MFREHRGREDKRSLRQSCLESSGVEKQQSVDCRLEGTQSFIEDPIRCNLPKAIGLYTGFGTRVAIRFPQAHSFTTLYNLHVHIAHSVASKYYISLLSDVSLL